MAEYISLSDEIEIEYELCMENRTKDVERLYRLLFSYLERVMTPIMQGNSCIFRDDVEDIVQDTLEFILGEGLRSFEKRSAKFATWCAVIAKNRAIDLVRKRTRHRLELMEEEMPDAQDGEGAAGDSRRDPERNILELEQKIALCEDVKECLRILLNLDEKPYRTVSCCYTLVLFQRYHPYTKELSSPSWAYNELEKSTVEFGAARFLREMREWMPHVELSYGDSFTDGLEVQENGCWVAYLVFGEQFKVKDFENWSRRIRQKIKKEFFELKKREEIVWEL